MSSLTQDALAKAIGRGDLAQAYVIVGGEELLVDECRVALRAALGAEERIVLQPEKGDDLSGLLSELGNLSLFGESRLFEVIFKAPPDAKAGAALLDAAQAARGGPDRLVVAMHGLDWRARKAKWLESLLDSCESVDVPTIGKDALPSWVAARLRKGGRSLTPEAMALFVEMTEGNLLAASQEILKIGLLFPEGEIDAETLQEEIVNLSRHDVFALQDALRGGPAAAVGRTLRNLRAEGAPEPLVLWALADEARALLALVEGRKHPGLWGKRRSALQGAARRADPSRLMRLLARVQGADLQMRGLAESPRDPWDEFLDIAALLRRLVAGGAAGGWTGR